MRLLFDDCLKYVHIADPLTERRSFCGLDELTTDDELAAREANPIAAKIIAGARNKPVCPKCTRASRP